MNSRGGSGRRHAPGLARSAPARVRALASALSLAFVLGTASAPVCALPPAVFQTHLDPGGDWSGKGHPGEGGLLGALAHVVGHDAAHALFSPVARNTLLGLAGTGALLFGGVLLLRARVRARTRELEGVNRQLGATLDAIPDLLFEMDGEGRYLAVHANREAQLQRPVEALLGRRVDEVLPAPAAQTCLAALAEAGRHGWSSGQQIEITIDNQPQWFELSVARKADDGGPAHFIVLSRDITARRRAEASVQRLSRLYATLSQCNQAIVRCASQDDLLRQICHDAVVFGEMKMVWIGLLDERDGMVHPAAAYGDGTEYLDGIRIAFDSASPFGRGPSGSALRLDKPVWCQDFANDPATSAWHERGARHGYRASAALPLHRGGKVFGVLNLYAGECHAFDEAAQRLLVEMAMDIDFALDRFEQDAERARLAAAIVDSEEKYRELTESINDVIWTVDPETRCFSYVSPAMRRLSGYAPHELIDAPIERLLKPEYVAEMRERMALHLAEFHVGKRKSEDYSVEEVELGRRDGGTVWAEVVTTLGLNRRSGRVEFRAVARDISERRAAEAEIQRLAHYDQLTGLPNRSLVKDRFRYAASLTQRRRGQLAVMFFDLDHFKNINDTLGHDFGDRLLVEVARRLESVLRGGDTVCRLGGDEFVFLLPDTDAEGAARVAAKLLEAVAQPLVLDHQELTVTPSIGIAMYPDDGTDFDTLSRNADAAMYQAKREGRNGFRFFTEAMQARSTRTLLLANALRHALDRGQFSLHYQPQVSLADGRVVGAEALLRWTHPEFGPVSPGEFVPIAESNGLIAQIGEWVLREAVAQSRRWLDEGLPPLVMAVNLSAAQFRNPNLPELVSQVIEEAGLPPHQVELELTEAVAMDDPQSAVRVMDALFARGIRMSIDDFGTGYSSLGYLKRFKVGKLKIDQSFVRDIGDDPDDKAIVSAIIHLAGSLGMLTVAEGVETLDQLDFLRQQGCDTVQGYYFSRPLPAEAFVGYLQESGALTPSPPQPSP
ncbi:EAL domain-containing protein [Azoarcus olearius]|uniref:GGDEF/EAL/PAS/PAC/GAF-domain containing protein n=1 Tax=Azoarcus sp. (strain BH72) TaxID=418699 RepID=A1KA22_AZOSB|nr:EAL domain-containing protein [Azoarcus olearius]CAL95678.1 GGDEF/EAL/PAS/PAC/GAF-domain containing protein [Azoarcus olearius]